MLATSVSALGDEALGRSLGLEPWIGLGLGSIHPANTQQFQGMKTQEVDCGVFPS